MVHIRKNGLSDDLSNSGSEFPPEWELTTLENDHLFEYLNGLWTGKKPPLVSARVLRNTNFNNDGTLDFEDVAQLQVEERQLLKKELRAGDIIIERSGGGPSQPVGRVVMLNRSERGWSFSNFTTCLRVADRDIVSPRFLLYHLLLFYQEGNTIPLQQKTTGIRNLSFADYKKCEVPLPPLPEQEKIASILSKIQQAIEVQEKIIEGTKELKKALMVKLFTEGLHGEELKETEIGLMPKSWQVVELAQVADIVYGAQAAVAHATDSSIGTPIFTNINITNDGELDLQTVRYYKVPEKKKDRLILNQGDILFNWRSGSREHVGKTAIFTLDGEYTFSSFILRFRVKDMVRNTFLFYFLQHLKQTGYFSQFRQVSSVNSVFNASSAATIPIVVPTTAEQEVIADAMAKVIAKVRCEERRQKRLNNLFRAMLHQLMTGQLRVNNIGIPFDA